MPAPIQRGDVVSLADFPGGDRPRRFRHSRHEDYEGEEPGFPELEFEVLEPLAWQAERPGGRWLTRIRARGGSDYLAAYLGQACEPRSCPRLLAKQWNQRAVECQCPRQLRVTLSTRTGRRVAEMYSRICGWIGDGMREDGRKFTAENWLRRWGENRVVVHHANPPVEDDAEDGPTMLKDDATFAGLEPQTPAEHDRAHAALAALRPAAAAARRRPAAAAAPGRDRDDAVRALVAEGVPRGRPSKRGRGGRR